MHNWQRHPKIPFFRKSRFALPYARPANMGIQADIADKGDWVKLKEYQDYLIAGRNPEQTLAAAG